MMFVINEVEGSGIYLIINNINHKIYVGKTKNFRQRYRQYRYDFSAQRSDHINPYLLRAFNKYGFENFTMVSIEINSDESLLSDMELKWMLRLNTLDRSKGYNLRMDSSTKMYAHPSTSAKISNNLKNQWGSGVRNDHSEKLKKSWEGNEARKQQQSKLLTRVKTKYKYIVENKLNGDTKEIVYEDLKEMGIAGRCLSKFHRRKTDKIIIDDCEIERIKI